MQLVNYVRRYQKSSWPNYFEVLHLSMSGDIISDKTKQLKRWVEHYSELYLRKNTLDAIERLTTLQELDDVPSLENVSKEIDQLHSGKAPGKDSILGQVEPSGTAAQSAAQMLGWRWSTSRYERRKHHHPL